MSKQVYNSTIIKEKKIMVDIKGLDKAKVLHALWHASHAQGLSFMGLNPEGFSFEHAKEIIEERQRKHQSLYFDYLEGHVIKCDITKDTFDEFFTQHAI